MYEFKILVVLLLNVLTLSGCIGYARLSPDECSRDVPYLSINDVFWNERWFGQGPRKVAENKSDFLNAWGKPDRIEATKSGDELWVYERTLWCGYIPLIIIPIPLILPTCDGYNKVVFHGDTPLYINTKHTFVDGYGILLFGGLVPIEGGRRPCRYIQ